MYILKSTSVKSTSRSKLYWDKNLNIKSFKHDLDNKLSNYKNLNYSIAIFTAILIVIF